MRQAMALTAILMTAAVLAAAGDLTETFDQTYPLAAGGRIGLENINGDVTVEVWDRDEVRVYAVKRASSIERLEKLTIDVDATGDQIEIETDYPSSRELPWDDRRGHSEVEYTLTVPRLAALAGIDLVNGDLLVDGVEGGVDADTVNGAVVIRNSAGELEIETVNGPIEIALGSVPSSDDVNLSSVNGAIDLRLLGFAEIRAETVNGRIRNDFGIEVRKGRYVGSSMSGAVGSGGPRVEMETVNGAITVSSR